MSYLRQIVPIHAERMRLEGVLFWWKDEVLLVVFAGLIKRGLLTLPKKNYLQALEIARICDEICRETKVKNSIFSQDPERIEIQDYEETMKKAYCRLLV